MPFFTQWERDAYGIERVPHVRLSVRGPKKMGEATTAFAIWTSESRLEQRKAIETYHLRPTYAGATRISCTWLHP
jgi:hypothetical protein